MVQQKRRLYRYFTHILVNLSQYFPDTTLTISLWPCHTCVIYHWHVFSYYYGLLTITDLWCVGWGEGQGRFFNTVTTITHKLENTRNIWWLSSLQISRVIQQWCHVTHHFKLRLTIPVLCNLQNVLSDFIFTLHSNHTVPYLVQIFLEQSQSIITPRKILKIEAIKFRPD